MEDQIMSDELYFTFGLSGGKYAVEVTMVKEILEFEKVTKVPKALPYMKGVMNNRGSVITVIDLRVLFGFEASDNLEKTDIVITEIAENKEKSLTIGFIADEVDVVTKLELVNSESVSFGVVPSRGEFIKGVGKLNGSFVLILDLKKILETIDKEVSPE